MPFRTHNFSLRLTDQEITSYGLLARENGVSVSEWARNVLNAEVKYKDEKWGPIREIDRKRHGYG